MAIKDSMILELLDPEAARRLQQKEAMNQQLAMAQARSPLLAQAYQTAGMLSSSLGGALGTDMRGPTEIRAQRVKDALAQTKGDIIEAAKIVQAEDPAGALALMQYGREMSPKLTRGDVKLGYKTITVKDPLTGMDTSKTVQDTKTGAFDEQGNLVGFYEAGGLRRISPEEAKAIQAAAQSTGVMKNDREPIQIGKGNVYLNAEMGRGVSGTGGTNIPPSQAAKIEERMSQYPSQGSRTDSRMIPRTPEQTSIDTGPIKGEVVARMKGVPGVPNIAAQAKPTQIQPGMSARQEEQTAIQRGQAQNTQAIKAMKDDALLARYQGLVRNKAGLSPSQQVLLKQLEAEILSRPMLQGVIR